MSATRITNGRALFWGKTSLRLLILCLVSWGIWHSVHEAWGRLVEAKFSPAQLRPGWLLAAGLAYLLGMFPCCLFWHRTLRSMRQRPVFRHVLRAYYVSQLGKYVPGKALVVIIRTAMIRGPCVDTAVAATSVFVETLTMMAVGAALAAAQLAVLFRQQQYLILLAVGFAVCAGAPTAPPVFRWIVRTLQVHRASRALDESLGGLNFRLMCFGWIVIAAGWLLLGLSLWATLGAMPGVRSNIADLPLLTVCVCLAVVAGFASMLPGGIGVRELVVMKLVAPSFGEVAAIVSAVLLRLIWLAAELVLAAVLYFAIPATRSAAREERFAQSEEPRDCPR